MENESPDIICWHLNNKAFRILDHTRFEREIIPKYFRHTQMSSVQRQLNLYGFKCVPRGEDKGVFYHTDFMRGNWDSAKLIRRSVAQNQFGLQSWKLPSDIIARMDAGPKKFDYNIDTKSEFVKPEKESNTNAYQVAQNWQWPPVHLRQLVDPSNIVDQNVYHHEEEQQQQPTNEINYEISYNEQQYQPSTLTSRLGFRAAPSLPLTEQEQEHQVPSMVYETFRHSINNHTDSFEDLMIMCDDLSSFLEDCETAQVV